MRTQNNYKGLSYDLFVLNLMGLIFLHSLFFFTFGRRNTTFIIAIYLRVLFQYESVFLLNSTTGETKANSGTYGTIWSKV